MRCVQTFSWPVRVYFEDTDSGGVVYYANYLRFMERARTEWLRSRGCEQDVLLQQSRLAFVVRAIALDYHRPARFNDLLEVRTRVIEARRASLRFGQQIVYAGATEQLLCAGTIKVACVETITWRPQAIPASLLTEMQDGS